MERKIITIPVEISRETRPVEFAIYEGDDTWAYSTSRVALCKTTGKYWPCQLRAIRQSDGTWNVARTTVRLNRQYLIVAWNDDSHKCRSQHNGVGRPF